jgi:exodeoxyribonuclease-5
VTQWSPQQQAALRAAWAWIVRRDHRPFYLAGYAGTGKTTLAREIAGLVDGRVLFAAYTGKAASVLRAKGCDKASTLHSLIYRRSEDARGNVVWTLNPVSELAYASLLILDECSMIDARMAADVLSFRVPVLVLGDPAQLPPVDGAGYFTRRDPDVLLTEVHRQAQDDPILRYATAVREGRTGSERNEGALRFLDAREIGIREVPTVANSAQVLVGTNRLRSLVNDVWRGYLGHDDPAPQDGETVVVLRNSAEYELANGELFQCDGNAYWFGPNDCRGSLYNADRHVSNVRLTLPGEVARPLYAPRKRVPIDFGYALTVHKAQGSEWDNVVVLDDGFGMWDRELRARWLYTAVTRARTGLTMIRRAA